MATGITFEFTHKSDLELAEAIMDSVVSHKFGAGQVQVRNDAGDLGIAGKMDQNVIKTIPKGAKLSLVGDFNFNEQIALVKEVGALNAVLPTRGTPVFEIVP